MTVIAFDISSGGITAAEFDYDLRPLRSVETVWDLRLDRGGAALLPVDLIADRFRQTVRALNFAGPVDAIAIGCFMHNCVLLGENDQAMTPVFTWLDRRGENGMEYIRNRMGDKFHERTGCRFHPMFPVFKLATLHLCEATLMAQVRRIASVKSWLAHRLTGSWAEDHGMACSSGFYNVRLGEWDSVLLGMLDLRRENLPPIFDRTHIVGRIHPAAASEFGLPESTPVVNGSGDGFLASLGSECETSHRLAMTLGTSAAVRQALSAPVLDPLAGTFCYRADGPSYLLGCASSNGGNVLDWARSLFGQDKEPVTTEHLPIFIPLLHGERSPEWNPRLTGSWHGLNGRHTGSDLMRSALEGVVFNLAHYVEIVQRTSAGKVTEIVLSGNGFLDPAAPPILAGIVDARVWMPAAPGMATLRGAGVCALRAMQRTAPPLDRIPVDPAGDTGLGERFGRYKNLRLRAGSEGV